MMNKKIRQQWGGEFESSWNGWRVFVDKNIFEAGRGYMYLGRRVPIAGQRMDTSLIFIDSTAPSWLKEQLELIAKRTDIDTPAHRTMWLLDIFAQADFAKFLNLHGCISFIEGSSDKQMRTYPFVPNGVRFRPSGRVAAPWRGSLRLGP